MLKKKGLITVVVAMALLIALGTTTALAAEGESEFGKGYGQRQESDERLHQYEDEEYIQSLVDEGTLTQEQADSILAGEAHISDFIEQEECDGTCEGLESGLNQGSNSSAERGRRAWASSQS